MIIQLDLDVARPRSSSLMRIDTKHSSNLFDVNQVLQHSLCDKSHSILLFDDLSLVENLSSDPKYQTS